MNDNYIAGTKTISLYKTRKKRIENENAKLERENNMDDEIAGYVEAIHRATFEHPSEGEK